VVLLIILVLVLLCPIVLWWMSIQGSHTKLAIAVKKAEKLAQEGEDSFSDEKYGDAKIKFETAIEVYKHAKRMYKHAYTTSRDQSREYSEFLKFLNKMNNRIDASEQAKRNLQRQKEEIVAIIEKAIK